MPALIILSLLALVAGVLSLSNATLGVGLIGVACYIGILARLLQAATYQNRQMGTLMETRDALQAILAITGQAGRDAENGIGGKPSG